MQELANHSKKKSDKLRAIEDGFHHMQEKDRQIGEQIYNTLEQEHTREVWLLKKEIEEPKKKNRLQAKTYRGNTLSTSLSCF
jgi:hypothetical protein